MPAVSEPHLGKTRDPTLNRQLCRVIQILDDIDLMVHLYIDKFHLS